MRIREANVVILFTGLSRNQECKELQWFSDIVIIIKSGESMV